MPTESPSRSWSAVLLLAGCALSVVAAAAADDNLPQTTVAVVNGEAITSQDLEKRLEDLHGAAGPTQRSAANLDRLLFRAVNDVLIGQEARILGLHEEPPVPEAIERNRRRLALSLLEQVEISDVSEPEDQEVADLFDERYSRASFHVLTAADPEVAEEMLAAMREGQEIEAVARRLSVDPYRERGGLLEDVLRKDLQFAIADVVFRLEPNEVAGPTKTDFGWSILVARDFQEPDPELFEEARPSLVRLVRRRKQDEARQLLLERLRERHPVTIDQELVDSIQPLRGSDGRFTAESPGPETAIARIGEEVAISGDEYALALEKRWKSIPEEDAARAAAPIILASLIGEAVFLAEAYRRGYDEQPAVRRALHGLETEMIIPKYLNSVLAAGIEVSEEEKRAHYEESKESLKRPPRMRLGQISVATAEEAESVAAALRAGTDLAWLAGQRSTDGLRGKGGLEDWKEIRPGDGPISRRLLEAEPGTVLEPIEREDSWVVYKVMAREEQGTYSYEEVSGNMRDAIFKQKFTARLDRFIKTARSRSEIEIREDVLASLRLSGTQEEAPEGGHGGHGGHGSD